MEKETYIYNHLKDFISGTDSRKDAFEKIAQWVYIEFQVNIFFCDIMGKRWSFIAGRQNVLSAPNRIPINEQLGIIAEDNTIKQDTWDALTRSIRQLANEGAIQ